MEITVIMEITAITVVLTGAIMVTKPETIRK